MLIKTHSSLWMFFLSLERPMYKTKNGEICAFHQIWTAKLCITSMMHFNHWAVPVDCMRMVLIFTQIWMVWVCNYYVLWVIKQGCFYPQRGRCIKNRQTHFKICSEAILKLRFVKPNTLDNYDTHFMSNRHNFCTYCNTERKCLCYNFFQALEKIKIKMKQKKKKKRKEKKTTYFKYKNKHLHKMLMFDEICCMNLGQLPTGFQ